MDALDPVPLGSNIPWLAGLLAPLVAGAITALLARRPGTDRVQARFAGALAAFALGAVGSYAQAELVLDAMDSGIDLPRNVFLQAWQGMWRGMWYPLGIGLVVGLGLALFALVPRRRAV